MYVYTTTCIPNSGKFHNFTLKQVFCGINFVICVLIFLVCVLILTISRINFRELSQIAKNAKYNPRENFPLYDSTFCTVSLVQYLLYSMSCIVPFVQYVLYNTSHMVSLIQYVLHLVCNRTCFVSD